MLTTQAYWECRSCGETYLDPVQVIPADRTCAACLRFEVTRAADALLKQAAGRVVIVDDDVVE